MLHLIPGLLLSASLWLTAVSRPNVSYNLSKCPFKYYGKSYSKLYVSLGSEVAAICFEDYYHVKTTQDCIIGPAYTPLTFKKIKFPSNSFKASLKKDLPSISQSLVCSHRLKINYTQTGMIDFLSYESESALRIIANDPRVFEFNFTINGFVQEKFTINNTGPDPTPRKGLIVSACRESGTLYLPGNEMGLFPEKCTRRICNSVGAVEDVGCPSLERCVGNNTCLFDPICTATGPTIITSDRDVHAITDRCAYTLWQSVNPAITLRGHYQERLRKDVIFLDSVSLILGHDTISLGQGGTVLLNNQPQNINSTSQEVVGVTLDKNKAGVTAKVDINSTVKFHLFFDGATAQLELTGDNQGVSFGGICSGATVSDSRDGGNGSVCTKQYNQAVDSNINCTQMAERCNVLNDPLFADCHNATDPAPFITACKNTLCVYPNVNGLDCQFLAAYARACSLRSDVLDNWWQDVSCSSPQAFCQDLICGHHEFCGDNVKGDTTCLCRAIFAAPFRSTDSYGGPAVCSQGSFSLPVVGCLLAENGINYTTLHLNHANCTGQMDENKIVTFSFNSKDTCGAVVTVNSSHTVFANTIVGRNDNNSGVVTRQDEVKIDFSCFYTQPEHYSFSFRIRKNSVLKTITSGFWKYSLTMRAYTDAGLSNTLKDTDEVELDQIIWLKLDSNGLEGGLVNLVTDSCWATSDVAYNSTPRYDLITNGCSSDNTVTMIGNGEGTFTSFSFRMFQFPDNSGDIYMHCQLHLCTAQNETCVPDCSEGVRRRRSATSHYVDGAPALITMSWTR